MKSPSALTKTLGFEVYSSVFGAHGKQQQYKPRILWGGQGTHLGLFSAVRSHEFLHLHMCCGLLHLQW